MASPLMAPRREGGFTHQEDLPSHPEMVYMTSNTLRIVRQCFLPDSKHCLNIKGGKTNDSIK